jgi:hypothetical protein
MALDLDWPALTRGMLTAACLAVPGGIVGAAVSDHDGLGWLGALAIVVVLIGLMAGGYVAARLQRTGTPFTHAILAALSLYVVVQVIGIVRRLVAGDSLTWGRYASSGLLSVIAGTVGGLLATWVASQGGPNPLGPLERE